LVPEYRKFMKWSFSIGRVAGTDVRIHATFFLLLAFIAFSFGAMGALLTVTLFFCVLLHEFGHIFAAKRYGIRTPDVTLLPIGGLARLERMPKKPSQELVVALAGPAVNVVIAAGLFLFLGGMPAHSLTPRLDSTTAFLQTIMVANIWLAIFNLTPAFPMDGGRVLRALLATKLPYTRATQIAATIGQTIAFAGGIWALLNMQPILVLIAFFIFIGAGQEASSVRMDAATNGLPVTSAMMTRFQILSPQDSLQAAITALLAGSQHDFPVVDGAGRVRGILVRADLFNALGEHGPGHAVYEVARKNPPLLRSDFMLTHALGILSDSGFATLPVLDAETDRLVGLLTSENVAEMMMIAQVVESRREKLGGPTPPPLPDERV
jgi:stage IV sporulation protein FB